MWTNPESPSAFPLHQLVISEHIATAASYHLLLLLHSLFSSPILTPSTPLSTSSPSFSSSCSPSSPPAFKCMALPGQAGLCRQHYSLRLIQSEEGDCGTGCALCKRGGGEGVWSSESAEDPLPLNTTYPPTQHLPQPPPFPCGVRVENQETGSHLNPEHV